MVVIIIFITTLTQGCATIYRGRTQILIISTNPSGANVNVINSSNANVFNCITPCKAELKKYNLVNSKVIIRKDGFETIERILYEQIEAFFIINCATSILFPIGMGIDYLTDSWKKAQTDTIIINLKPISELNQNNQK